MVWSRQDEPAAMTSRKGVGGSGGSKGAPWRLYEAYTLQPFVAILSPTAHNQAERSKLCTLHMCLRAQFQACAVGKPTAGGDADKRRRSCLRFPTSPAGEGG